MCLLLFFPFWPPRMTWEILVSLPGIAPQACTVKSLSPNHWTTREFPVCIFFSPLSSKQPQLTLSLSLFSNEETEISSFPKVWGELKCQTGVIKHSGNHENCKLPHPSIGQNKQGEGMANTWEPRLLSIRSIALSVEWNQ